MGAVDHDRLAMGPGAADSREILRKTPRRTIAPNGCRASCAGRRPRARAPAETIAMHVNEPAQHPALGGAHHASGPGEDRPQPLHQRLAQPEALAHAATDRRSLNHAASGLSSQFMGFDPRLLRREAWRFEFSHPRPHPILRRRPGAVGRLTLLPAPGGRGRAAHCVGAYLWPMPASSPPPVRHRCEGRAGRRFGADGADPPPDDTNSEAT